MLGGENMNLQDGVTLFESLYVTVFSMAIVFAALAAIAGILSLLKFVGHEKKKKNEISQQVVAPKVEEPVKMVVETNNELEVAIVMAAIEAFTGKSRDSFVVRAVKRMPNTTSPWAMSGRQSNMTKTIK